jgi:hypothetical protein
MDANDDGDEKPLKFVHTSWQVDELAQLAPRELALALPQVTNKSRKSLGAGASRSAKSESEVSLLTGPKLTHVTCLQ